MSARWVSAAVRRRILNSDDNAPTPALPHLSAGEGDDLP